MHEETLTFKDRREAGRRLAAGLMGWQGRGDVVVLGLPRGGVPVAFEVAAALRAPLDVWIVRKLGMPGREEVAMGAIAGGGITVLNEGVLEMLPDAPAAVARAVERETAELQRRGALYRQGRAAPELRGKVVILVDDGLATGATMRAAVQALQQCGVARCVVAVPVGSPEACEMIGKEADEVMCLSAPQPFYSVGEFYRDFEQTRDEEVISLLKAAAQWTADAAEMDFTAAPSAERG